MASTPHKDGTAAPPTKDTLAELQWLSDRLSAQVRAIALAVLAVAWALIFSQPANLTVSTRSLLWVCVIALLTLIADLLQYVVGYINTRRHHREVLRTKVDQGYDPDEPLYRARRFLFWAKQVLAGASFIALVWVLLPVLLNRA
jgi:hypothetical protein